MVDVSKLQQAVKAVRGGMEPNVAAQKFGVSLSELNAEKKKTINPNGGGKPEDGFEGQQDIDEKAMQSYQEENEGFNWEKALAWTAGIGLAVGGLLTKGRIFKRTTGKMALLGVGATTMLTSCEIPENRQASESEALQRELKQKATFDDIKNAAKNFNDKVQDRIKNRISEYEEMRKNDDENLKKFDKESYLNEVKKIEFDIEHYELPVAAELLGREDTIDDIINKINKKIEQIDKYNEKIKNKKYNFSGTLDDINSDVLKFKREIDALDEHSSLLRNFIIELEKYSNGGGNLEFLFENASFCLTLIES